MDNNDLSNGDKYGWEAIAYDMEYSWDCPRCERTHDIPGPALDGWTVNCADCGAVVMIIVEE